MMEKRGVVESGRTPPEDEQAGEKRAEDLASHVTRRAADALREEIKPDASRHDAT